MLADWIGAGVDPERSIVFRQSQVPEHAELALLLGMITPKSWLERVPTYKGQIAELGEQIDTYGFFGYPVLQTADIVAVPRDQGAGRARTSSRTSSWRARSCAASTTCSAAATASRVFPEPEAVLTEAPVLLGIDNRKMSKSYGNAIELGSEPDTIRDMVGRMITDPQKIRRGDPGRPEICNVFSYEKLFGTPADRVAEIDRTCRTGELGCREHKDEISERIVEYLRPFRERREQALADRGELERLLDARRRARARDRRAEHGAREGGDGAVSSDRRASRWTASGPRGLRGPVRPARHADPERGRRPARGPPRGDRARLHRAARGARRARPRGRHRVPDPDRRAAGAEVAADAALRGGGGLRHRAAARPPRSCSRACSSTASSGPRSEWLHERFAAERPYRYRAAPLPPELRRVAFEAARKAYEPDAARRRDARRCCARRRSWTRAT